MNNSMKEKWANRTAYAILAMLLIAALTVTVVAITSTVNQRKEPLPDEEVNGEPSEDTSQTDEPTPPPDDTPSDETNTQPPEEEKKPDLQVFVLPTSGYVMREYTEDALVFSPTMNDYRVHLGVDLAGKIGDPVYAFCEGTVKEISNHPFMGKTIVISHANGIESRYMNLANEIPENIKVGETVAVGTVIGAIGETALAECADSPHLHFEVWANGKQTAPSGYVTFNTDTPTFDGEE